MFEYKNAIFSKAHYMGEEVFVASWGKDYVTVYETGGMTLEEFKEKLIKSEAENV
jgi:hypothetical protein